MRVVFIGTVEFSLKSLEKLISLNTNIVGVCTKQRSNFNSDFADLSPICRDNSIPYSYSDDVNSKENIEWIDSLTPDIIFGFGWSSLIKKELLNLAPMGVIGFHPAALPQNRGRHPIIWALVLGLTNTASTFFFMNEGADTGDVLSQSKIPIEYEDDAKSLYHKIVNTALAQSEEFLPKLQNRTYKCIPQNHSLSNSWRKRGKGDGLIDFRMNSKAIYNLVRALTKPYVGAHIEYKGSDISIWRVEEASYDKINIEPGKVLKAEKNCIIIKTYDGAIRIVEHGFKEIPKEGEYL